jgi:hypothetical protein
MPESRLVLQRLVVAALIGYLMVIGVGAAIALVANFPGDTQKKPASTGTAPGEPSPTTEPSAPTRPETTPPAASTSRESRCDIWLVPVCATQSAEQRLMLLAFLAGIIGSFLHAAQSLATYVGNDDFKLSWTAWYLLRPWIGGILGFAIYFVARAGLIGGAGASDGAGVNVYGLVAIGMLGGWFSKTTTDKLQEVFSTLFKTDADKARKDKLTSDAQPVVTSVDIASGAQGAPPAVVINGNGFIAGAIVTIGGTSVPVTFTSTKSLTVDVAGLSRPTGDLPLIVKNPSGARPESTPFTVNIP